MCFFPNCLPQDSPGDSLDLRFRLIRAHKLFMLWCSANSVSPGLRSFTRNFLNFTTRASFAWINAKGSDVMHLMRWLKWYVALRLEMPDAVSRTHTELLKLFLHTTDHGLKMFSIMHGHGLWLSRPCSEYLYNVMMIFLKGYKALGSKLLSMGMTGFGLKPKFRGLHHLAFAIRTSLQRGANMALNPLAMACEQCEDTVGRVSRVSRILNTRTITKRVLQLYFLKKKALIRRFQQNVETKSKGHKSQPRAMT